METGKLYIVATPIGNLEDMTFRAVNTLREVDIIAAEDTRKAQILLTHYQIRKPLKSYHQVNEEKSADKIIVLLEEGKNIAVISEAGTPCISDPGYVLVRKAKEREIDVIPIPGPSASIAAMSVSGLPTDKFMFLGFLPMKNGKKKKILESYKDINCPLIIYESPHRLIKTLEIMKELLGNKMVFIGRELTKLHEEKTCCAIEDAIEKFSNDKIRGEFVLIVNLKQD